MVCLHPHSLPHRWWVHGVPASLDLGFPPSVTSVQGLSYQGRIWSDILRGTLSQVLLSSLNSEVSEIWPVCQGGHSGLVQKDVSGLGTPVEAMVLLGDQRAAGGCRLRS